MIDGTTLIRGECGHIWSGVEFDGCPICAMMRGIETRVQDLVKKDAEKDVEILRLTLEVKAALRLAFLAKELPTMRQRSLRRDIAAMDADFEDHK